MDVVAPVTLEERLSEIKRLLVLVEISHSKLYSFEVNGFPSG
jgi:hypothetical protein